MSGSTGIGGATDGNFALKETKCGSGKAIMYCQGRDIEYTELRMHFDTDAMRWIIVAADKAFVLLYVFTVRHLVLLFLFYDVGNTAFDVGDNIIVCTI